MATLAEQMDAVANPSENYGTGFLTGQRVGNFQAKDGTVNRGVWVGNTKPFVFNLINPQNAYAAPLNISSSQYLPLSNFTQSSMIIQNFGIKFDAPRLIRIDCGAPFTANVSSFSQWGQQQYESIVGLEDSGVFYAYVNYGISILTSIYFETSVGNTVNFKAVDIFELPYTDNENGTTLSQVILANQPVMVSSTGSEEPYFGNWNFTYSIASTTPGQNVRPTIEFNTAVDTGVTYEDNSILTVLQLIDNAGFTFENNFLELDNPYPNNIEKVIGIAPNNIGFTSWKG